MRLIKYKKINKKINNFQLRNLIFILKVENRTSILANLSKKNINKYLQEVVVSKNLELFVIIKKDIIGYALLANKPEYLMRSFERFKLNFFFDLLLNLKFITLFNIFLAKFGFDQATIPVKNKKIFSESLNLNLLGIKKDYQSKGIGKNFLKYIFKYYKFKNKYIVCETDNFRSNRFYKKKLNFKSIGKKIRFPKLMDVLAKKL
tara:strand:+ start:653 stop:1264 length:612 start_codon:yes stop_codon:yes gene_type:complete